MVFSIIFYNIRRNPDLFKADENRESAVGIATGYGLDDQEVGVRVSMGARIFTSPCHPDRLWGPPNLLSNGYVCMYKGWAFTAFAPRPTVVYYPMGTGGSFPGGKAAEA
jgi:hypothetical protein